MFTFIFFATTAIAYALFVWFDTRAFVEYMNLLGLSKFCKVGLFTEMTSNDPTLSYPKFIVTNWNSFFTRMISCPKCLVVWLSFFVSLGFFIGNPSTAALLLVPLLTLSIACLAYIGYCFLLLLTIIPDILMK